jgi:hypothetical protein
LGRGKNGKGSLGEGALAIMVQLGNETHIDGRTLLVYHTTALRAPLAVPKLLIIKNKMKIVW